MQCNYSHRQGNAQFDDVSTRHPLCKYTRIHIKKNIAQSHTRAVFIDASLATASARAHHNDAAIDRVSVENARISTRGGRVIVRMRLHLIGSSTPTDALTLLQLRSASCRRASRTNYILLITTTTIVEIIYVNAYRVVCISAYSTLPARQCKPIYNKYIPRVRRDDCLASD